MKNLFQSYINRFNSSRGSISKPTNSQQITDTLLIFIVCVCKEDDLFGRSVRPRTRALARTTKRSLKYSNFIILTVADYLSFPKQ